MAQSEKDKKATDAPEVNPDGTPKVPDPAESAEAEGRAPQAAERAEASGDASKMEEAARSEEPPVPDPDTDKKPEASANPTEVLGPSDSGPNQMSTAGLNPIQTARVEGTPIDGQLGANFARDNAAAIEADRAERAAKADKKRASRARSSSRSRSS